MTFCSLCKIKFPVELVLLKAINTTISINQTNTHCTISKQLCPVHCVVMFLCKTIGLSSLSAKRYTDVPCPAWCDTTWVILDKGLGVLSSVVQSSPKSSAVATFFQGWDDIFDARGSAAKGELVTWASPGLPYSLKKQIANSIIVLKY